MNDIHNRPTANKCIQQFGQERFLESKTARRVRSPAGTLMCTGTKLHMHGTIVCHYSHHEIEFNFFADMKIRGVFFRVKGV